MKAYVIDFNPKKTRVIGSADSPEQAAELLPTKGRDFIDIVGSVEDLAQHTMGELVELYNVAFAAPGKEVRRFESRFTGATRIMACLSTLQTAVKATKKATKGPRKPGSGALIRQLLVKGMDADAILAEVQKQFPDSKATKKDVAWNKWKLEKDQKEATA